MNDLLHAIGFYCRGPQPHLHRYSRVHSKANIENYASNSKSCVNVSCAWLLFNVWKRKLNGFSGSLSFLHLSHTLAQPWFTELKVLPNFDIFHLNLKFIKHQLEAWYHIICMQRQLKSNIFLFEIDYIYCLCNMLPSSIQAQPWGWEVPSWYP